MYSGNITQKQGGGSLGQTAPKGSSKVGSFIATGFVLLMVSKCWVQFHGACTAVRL